MGTGPTLYPEFSFVDSCRLWVGQLRVAPVLNLQGPAGSRDLPLYNGQCGLFGGGCEQGPQLVSQSGSASVSSQVFSISDLWLP